MSLYHETADILSADSPAGGSLRSRIFANKDLKSPPAQVYALALETCKWSPVLKEIIEKAELLRHERKLTPILSSLLVHDFLVSKSGIALPSSHGLRQAVERHKARLTSEFTRARLRRKCASLAALKAQVEVAASSGPAYPRWIRINRLKGTLDDQLNTTFAAYQQVPTVREILEGAAKALYVDANVPDLVAVSPTSDIAKWSAYKTGAIILQDKASCFPAYLLDPRPEDGDVIDSCAAPGNKTTHLAAHMASHAGSDANLNRIFAFEKDARRAEILKKMVRLAGSDAATQVNPGQDFLQVDPNADAYSHVGALLLDPSCSGSGIVGRDEAPRLDLPVASPAVPTRIRAGKLDTNEGRKRKRRVESMPPKAVLVDDEGNESTLASERELKERLDALSSFQLSLLLHAFKFPAATKITYSTCSTHAEENEHVVLRALQSAGAKERGWKILKREAQVDGLRAWPVRGSAEDCQAHAEVAEACIRTYTGDKHGVMGFFVAGFVRDPGFGKVESRASEQDLKETARCVPNGAASCFTGPTSGKNHSGSAGTGLDRNDENDEEWDGFDD